MSPGKPDPELDATLREFEGGRVVFSRYKLSRILGRGGMGVVWLARDTELDRDVALKFLPDMIVRDRGVLRDLKRETRRSLDLTHPNIVRTYDFIQDAESACISMEYIDGDTLANFRADRPEGIFQPAEILDWLRQLCEALSYAHDRARLVHRDLKPANLMISRAGELKIADFGIARGLSDSASVVTADRGTSGTLAYMSPQQLNGDPASHLDDVYAVGATLYELFTSKPPFYSGNLDRQIRENDPMPMQKRRGQLGIEAEPLSAGWQNIVSSCLAKDPRQRPQTVAALWRLIEAETKATPIALPKTDRVRAWIISAAIATFAGALLLAGRLLYHKSNPGFTSPPADLAANTQSSPAQLSARPPAFTTNPNLPAAFENSLRMKFVPVPNTKVLFSIWDTRVKDYDEFVKATAHEFESPPFLQGPTHPVANVSWKDAKAFCEWLTEKERHSGALRADQEYRLPTDNEWSIAVQLTDEKGSSPMEKNGKIKDKYPWGSQWPPPAQSGNYGAALKVDDFPYTSPVGSFPANEFGLYDLGGNVWQWCEDWTDGQHLSRVLRGSTWVHIQPELILLSTRVVGLPATRYGGVSGFRCVLAPVSTSAAGD